MPVVAFLVTMLLGQTAIAETTRLPEISYTDRLSVNQQIARERYGLNDEEWQRVAYLEVLDQPFGDKLSPIELLGKYAETDAERARYARLYTAVYVDQMRRSQAWALAIQQVAQERDLTREVLNSTPQIRSGLDRLGIRPPITDATRALYQRRSISPPSATTLFVSLDCESTCGEVANRLSRQVLAGFTREVDIVFVNTDGTEQDDIIEWLKGQEIDLALLQSGKLELHFDSAYWRELRTSDDVPQVIEP